MDDVLYVRMAQKDIFRAGQFALREFAQDAGSNKSPEPHPLDTGFALSPAQQKIATPQGRNHISGKD